jgi:hypothetical protein
MHRELTTGHIYLHVVSQQREMMQEPFEDCRLWTRVLRKHKAAAINVGEWAKHAFPLRLRLNGLELGAEVGTTCKKA